MAVCCTPQTHYLACSPQNFDDRAMMTSVAVADGVDLLVVPIGSAQWLAQCSSSVENPGPSAVTSHLEENMEAVRSFVVAEDVEVE